MFLFIKIFIFSFCFCKGGWVGGEEGGCCDEDFIDG